MRIITGTLKGRRIHIPNTLDVRPTADRTKEGLFGVIDARRYIRDARVLDLFAGSGNLGIEAISRGAEEVLFVDHDRRNISHIEKTASEFDIKSRVRTRTSTVERFLKEPATPYDLIFADPPYDYEFMEQMVETIINGGWLGENGWLILEHDKYHDFSAHPHCFFSKAYGRTTVSMFQSNPNKHDS